jgi:hypothetical protein
MKVLLLLSVFFIIAPHSSFAGFNEVKACLKQALEKESPIYQVPENQEPDGYTRYLAMLCNGDPAKELFESISGPASAGDWNGKTRGDTKFLAEEGGASMCYHITRDADGEKANDYSCSIRLNIDAKELGKVQSASMSPIPTKESPPTAKDK